MEVGSGGCFPNFRSLQRSPSGAVRNDCPLLMVWSGAREATLALVNTAGKREEFTESRTTAVTSKIVWTPSRMQSTKGLGTR